MKFLLHIRVYVWHKQSAHIRIEYHSIVRSLDVVIFFVIVVVASLPFHSIEMKCADSLSTCTTSSSCSYCDSVCLTFRIRYLCGLLCMLKLSPRNRGRKKKRASVLSEKASTLYMYLIINLFFVFSFSHSLFLFFIRFVNCIQCELNAKDTKR